MHSPWLGEFLGTLVLIYLGTGVCAGVNLRKSYAAGSGWIVITTGWALAVMCGVMIAQGFGSHDAAINPAVTLAGAIVSGNYANVLSLCSAQLLGAFCGASIMTLHYAPHWSETDDQATKLGIFCTAPAIYKPWANLTSEILGTMLLVIVAGAIFSPGVAEKGPAAGFGPWLVGSLVWGIGLSLGGTTGYAINPARDLGPRLAHAILPIPGKGGSNWGYAPIPVIGPLIGATLAGVFLKFMHPW